MVLACFCELIMGFCGFTWISWLRNCSKYQKPWFIQGFWYFARSQTREIQVFPRNPRNSPKNAKYHEIRKKYFQIHVSKTYLILILAIRPVLFTPNVQIYLETLSLQRENNVPKLPGVLDERCEKLGTNHNVNSFSIRSLLEQTVVERAHDYPC